MKPVKLFCIPYSGGSAEVYKKWNKHLSKNIIIYPVELSGRSRRILDPLYERYEDAVEDISRTIIENLEPDDTYAVLGHSMGALLAYETYYQLLKKGCRMPSHMFFTGRKAPHDRTGSTAYHLLPDSQFLDVVYQYGNNTREVMQNPELMEIFLPIIRADFKISETYTYALKNSRILCDITIINGIEDEAVSKYDMNLWETLTDGRCNIRTLCGDHFFLLEHIENTVSIINQAVVNQ